MQTVGRSRTISQKCKYSEHRAKRSPPKKI